MTRTEQNSQYPSYKNESYPFRMPKERQLPKQVSTTVSGWLGINKPRCLGSSFRKITEGSAGDPTPQRRPDTRVDASQNPEERTVRVAHSTERLSVRRWFYHTVDRRPEILRKTNERPPTREGPSEATPRLHLCHQRRKREDSATELLSV